MQRKQHVSPRLVFVSSLVLGFAGQIQAQDGEYVFSAEQKDATSFTKDANQACTRRWISITRSPLKTPARG